LIEEIKNLVNKIDNGISNLEKRYDFLELKYKSSVLVLKDCITKYKTTEDLEYVRRMITKWHEGSTPPVGGRNPYDKTIWDVSIEVGGEITMLDEIFFELENVYVKYMTT
jgi:hypothetical protein